MFKKLILLCLALSLLLTCSVPALAVDPVEYYTAHSVEELVQWINTAEANEGEDWEAWYPFLHTARKHSELLMATSASEGYTLEEILVPAGQDNMQFFFKKGNSKFLIYIELPGTVDNPKPSLPERIANINRELALAYEGVQFTAIPDPITGEDTDTYYHDGGEYRIKGSDETELFAPTTYHDWLGYTIMRQGIGDLYGSKWDYTLFSPVQTKTVALDPIEFAGDDITEKFEDEAFRNFVYSTIKKTPGEPIYDTDVVHIRELRVSNSADKPPVKSLAGIEYFTSLEYLRIVNCQIIELDVTMLKNLNSLTVFWNRSLKFLNVSGLEKLEVLSCFENELTELQLSSPSLISIVCMDNQLSELDLSGCPALEELYCDDNKLQTLDVSPCPKLDMLSCTGNLFKDTSAIIGYDDREWKDTTRELCFHPQKNEPSDGFVLQDVAVTDWFYDEIQYVYKKGLMNGVASDRFAPQDDVSRAMAATVLYRLAGEPEAKGSNPFTDVEEGQWYSDAIIWAAGEKIIEGYGDGSFGTNDPVTREQLVTLFWRYQGRLAVEADALATFGDTQSVSPWAEDAFAWAVSTGLIQGKPGNILDPTGTTSRAQLATILMRTNEAN